MESIGKDCGLLKQEYDACFNKWYAEKFLKGHVDPSKETVPCEELFKTYRKCVVNAMKEKNMDVEEVMKKVIGTENEKEPPEEEK
eukprot:gene430-1071_t